MTLLKCTACSVTFASPYALKSHISSKHRNRVTSDNYDNRTLEMPFEEPGLWDDDNNVGTPKIPYREEPDLWNIDDDNNNSKNKNKMVSNNFNINETCLITDNNQ